MSNVVVIGAGVAGIQAALDIAAHGIHVDLIEREPTIGGHMAQLDKTFPTNDCSMCILSPKMVDVSRHPRYHHPHVLRGGEDRGRRSVISVSP